MQASTGTEVRVEKLWNYRAQFNAAEKGGEGMALRIFTGAKPFLKASVKLVDITGIRMLTLSIHNL
jgi:hypothetical protein